MESSRIEIFNNQKARWVFVALFFGTCALVGPLALKEGELLKGVALFAFGMAGVYLACQILFSKTPPLVMDGGGLTWSLPRKFGPVPWSEITEVQQSGKDLVITVHSREKYYASRLATPTGDGPVILKTSLLGVDPSPLLKTIQARAAGGPVTPKETLPSPPDEVNALQSIWGIFSLGMIALSVWFLMKAWWGGVPSIFQSEEQKAYTAATEIIGQELSLPPVAALYKNIAWKKTEGDSTSYMVIIEFDAQNPTGIASNGLNYVANRVCMLAYFRLQGDNVYHDPRAGSVWPCQPGAKRREIVPSILEMLGEKQ